MERETELGDWGCDSVCNGSFAFPEIAEVRTLPDIARILCEAWLPVSSQFFFFYIVFISLAFNTLYLSLHH